MILAEIFSPSKITEAENDRFLPFGLEQGNKWELMRSSP